MGASIAGEAAVRIVPSVRGFHAEATRKLQQRRLDVKAHVNPEINNIAAAKVEAYRKAQEANAVKIHIKTDWEGLRRELAQVEHVFKRNSLSRALRFNVVVMGLDALPVLAYGAAGAAASLDALAKSAFALPGALGGAIASVGTLGVGLSGVKDAFKSFDQSQKQVATQARIVQDSTRQLARSYRDYGTAVRDTIRDIQDLNAENRRSSLNVADAILGVQEAANRLREGGQKTILDLRRDQLGYLQAVDRLQEVQTRAQRVAEDVAQANSKGVQGADRVVDALDQINKNIEKLNTDKLDKADEAMAKMSPNFQAFAGAVRGLADEWGQLRNTVQDNLFAGLDKTVVDLANNTLPMLERGMGRVATSYNGLFKSFAQEIGSGNSTSLMDSIFGNTDVGLQRLSVGMKPFVDGIMRLTKESSDFLPRLGDAGAKVATRFDNWVTAISNDGRLDRWIDRGLDGMTNLGNTLVNLGSALSTMSEAFDRVTGNQGGFLKFLETQSGKLADYLKSNEGQRAMSDYFKNTQEFIRKLADAYVDIRPMIKEVIETAREWSVWLFRGIGAFATFTMAVDKHLGIVKPLLAAYFTYRTTKPIWELLSNSFKAYTGLIQSAGNNATLGKWGFFQWQMDKLDQMRGKAKDAADAVVAVGSSTPAASKSSTSYSSKGSYDSPMDEAKRYEAAAEKRAKEYPGTLQDRLASGNQIFLERQEKQRAAKAAATAAFESANPALPPIPALGPDNSRSSNPKKRKDFKRQQARLSNYWERYLDSTPAPAMGAMQGPALPPQILDELKNKPKQFDAVADAIENVGDQSAKTGEKVKDLGGNANSAATSVDNTGKQAKKAKADVDDLGKKAKATATSADSLHTSAKNAAGSTASVGDAAAKTKTPLDEAKSSVKSLGDEVGSGRVGLVGRLTGFAAMLGPQMALMAGLAAVSWAVNKLGEDHRDAAEAAKDQQEALQNLAGTLDSVTGGITRNTVAQMGTDAGRFTDQSGMFPQVDVNAIAQRLGFTPYNLYLNAADPSKGDSFRQDIAKVDQLIADQVASSPEYQQNKDAFDTYSLDPLTIAKAMRGDQGALAKVNAARDTPIYESDGTGGTAAVRTPDLVALARSLPNQDAFFLGRFLNDRNMSQSAAGNAIASANMALGRAKLLPAGDQLFSQYGPDQTMFIDPATGNGVVQLRAVPDQATIDAWSEKGIRVEDNGPGAMAKVTIDPQYAGTYLQRFADGGMVRGPGGPRDDKVLAKVSPGEHITNASAVKYYGSDVFHALNKMALPKFAVGGWPFPLRPVPSPDPGGPIGSGGSVGVPVAAPAPAAPPPPPAPAAPPPSTPPLAAEAPNPVVPSPSSGPAMSYGFGANTGLAYMPLFGDSPQLSSFGGVTSGSAWSTMKVPIALAALRNSQDGVVTPDMVAAITRSDNDAALRIWKSLGDDSTAAAKVQALLRQSGDQTTMINTQKNTPYSAFGQTDWSLANQVKFLSYLYGDKSSAPILDLMSQISPDQRWGLGGLAGAQFKGGWGPDAAGNYLSRQMGIVDGPGGKYAVALASQPASGALADANRSLTDIGMWARGNMGQNIRQNDVFTSPTTPQPIQLNADGTAPLPGPVPGQPLRQGYTNPAAAYSLAAQMNGRVPYNINPGQNFSMNGIDCSGMASAVVNSYLGLDPFSSRMATSTARPWLAQKGFVDGVGPPGSLRVGWYNNSDRPEDGHMAVTLPDGTNVESSSGVGVRMGGGAMGADEFPIQMWLPASSLQGTMSPDQMMQMAGAYMPGMQYPPGYGPLLSAGANGMYPGGVTPDMLTADQIQQRPLTELDKMLMAWQEDPNLPQFLKPQQLLSFFGSQAGQLASSLLGIGTNFLSGITGIDFGWVTGMAQNIGNAGMQAFQGFLPSYITDPQTGQGGGSQSPTGDLLGGALPDPLKQILGLGGQGGALPAFAGASPGTNAAGSIIDGMVKGQLPLDDPKVKEQLTEMGFNPGLVGGTDSTTESMSEGAIKAAVEQMGPALGIGENKQAWIDALMGAASSGSDLFAPEGNPNLGTPIQKAGAALSKAVRKWGIDPVSRGPQNVSFANGGNPLQDFALLSNGEFRTNPKATAHYGSGLFDALNAKAIPRSAVRGFMNGGWPRGFAAGGWPTNIIPDPIIPPGGGQIPGPLPLPAPAASPTPMPEPPAQIGGGSPPAPDISLGGQPAAIAVPSTGGAPGPGAPAPAPDPGALPQVQDALQGIGGLGAAIGGGGGGGLPQPGATANQSGDPRSVLGAAPMSQEHNLPALATGIKGAWNTVGGLVSQGIQAAAMGASMGVSGGAPIPGASQAGAIGGQLAQAGAQIGGEWATGLVNILSSLMVGTATNGSTPSASGIPLLPQRQPMQTGVPRVSQGRVHNGDVYVTNMDDYRRTQERMDAQAAMPFIGKY